MRIPRRSILTRPTAVTRGGILFTAGAEIINKTAETQVVNNSTTLVNDDALLAALAANEALRFLCHLAHIGNSTADFKATFTFPAGATMRWGPISGMVYNAADGPAIVDSVTASGTTLTWGGATSTRLITLIGWVVNGATAGNLQLQWAQDTATVVDTYVRTNSFLMVWRD